MLSNMETAILGLVFEQPCYGYQLEQVIEARGMREWTDIGFSSIYHVLNKLEKAQLLASETTPSQDGPGRKIYHITTAGTQQLRDEVFRCLSQPRLRSGDFDLGLSYITLLDDDAALQALQTCQTRLQQDHHRVTKKWHSQKDELPWFVNALFDHNLTQIQTEQHWVEQFINQIKKEGKMSDKIDLRKEWKHLYQPSKKNPEIVDVPAMDFLMIDGAGDPNNNPAYQKAVSALFSLSYTIKFIIKKSQGVDYAVMPLEGLWWVEDLAKLNMNDKSNWFWTMMIMQPEWVTAELVEEGKKAAAKKGVEGLENIRFESYHEGLAVQLMHIGPYADEMPNIDRMHKAALAQGYQLHKKHHEIYLSDPNKAAPEKMLTILRQPVYKA